MKVAYQTAYGTAEVRLSVVREDTLAAVVPAEQPMCNRAELACGFFRDHIAKHPLFDGEKECFIVLMLDRRNRMKGWNFVTLGTQTQCLAHPREVFRAAIVGAAAAVICMHNHPSGDPAPSAATCLAGFSLPAGATIAKEDPNGTDLSTMYAADVQLTRQMREAGNAVDIAVLDHVVVGRAGADPLGKGYYSFREAGLL